MFLFFKSKLAQIWFTDHWREMQARVDMKKMIYLLITRLTELQDHIEFVQQFFLDNVLRLIYLKKKN